VLLKQGHGKAVDWYLLGVVLYEMLVGLPPYYAHSQAQLFENIKHAKLKFPRNLSIEVILLLKGVNFPYNSINNDFSC